MNAKILPRMIVAGAALVSASVLGAYVWRQEHRPHILEVWVFGLQNGRSTFMRTPDDKRILIDGGSNSSVIRELTKILPFYSRRIDVIIASNSEGKNVSGLIDILERYSVDKVIVPAFTTESLGLASSSDQIYATFIKTATRLNVPIEKISAGDTLALDPKVSARILFPAPPNEFLYSKASPPELVLNISYGETVVMLAGSITTKIQKSIASSTPRTLNGSSVLVFLQNPSTANLSLVFMDRFKPEYLIYSKAITKSSAPAAKSTASSKKKPPADPLAMIPIQNRSNIKEEGTMKIESDGLRMEIKSAP